MELIQITPNYLGGAKGIQTILNSYYEQQLASIAKEEEQLAARRLIEEGLIVDGARVSLAAAIVKNNYAIEEELLEQLLHTRLIRVENTHLGRAYEVSHDTLVQPILKSYETRRLEEERLEQQRLLEKEQKKRRRFRLIAMLGTLLFIAALVGLYIVWQQSKALKEQQQHLELSMAVAESSVHYSENNYIAAFDQAYQSYEKYQKLIATHAEDHLQVDLLTEKYLQQLKDKEPYIYRNIWSSFYATEQLYRVEDKIYSTPLPLVLNKAWVSLPTTQNANLASVGTTGALQLFDSKTQKLDSVDVPFAMDWLINLKEGSSLISKDANRLLFLDTTNTLILLDRSTQQSYSFTIAKEYQQNFDFLLQEDGELLVIFDYTKGGITVYDYKGKQVDTFPNYQFLALQDDKLYYQEMDFNQIGIIDLKTAARYFISLPSRAEQLFVLADYVAVQLEGKSIAKVLIERSKKSDLLGYKLVDVLEEKISNLAFFEQNTLIVETLTDEGKNKTFLWEIKSNKKKVLGGYYNDILQIDSLLLYLDNNVLSIYQPSGLKIELMLPNDFDCPQMYALKNRYLCLPNIHQDKTLVIDLKMSPVSVSGLWGTEVLYARPSPDGELLLVISTTTVYVQSLKDNSIVAQTTTKEGWNRASLEKVELWSNSNKVLVQTPNYTWSWDYKTTKEVFYEGNTYWNNGFLCHETNKGYYKIINIATNQELWTVEGGEIMGCWFAPIQAKEAKGKSWAVLSQLDEKTKQNTLVIIDFVNKQAYTYPATLQIDKYAVATVDFSPDGNYAAFLDWNTKNILIVNNEARLLGQTPFVDDTNLKWLNNEDLLLVNQRDVITISYKNKVTKIREEYSLKNLAEFNPKNRRHKTLSKLKESSNKLLMEWDGFVPQLYQNYVFFNKKHEQDGDATTNNGFMYTAQYNRQLLKFPDFFNPYVYSSSITVSDKAQKAWTVSIFYKKIETSSKETTKLSDYDKGYLLEFDLDPAKLADRLKVSRKAIEELLKGKVMTIN